MLESVVGGYPDEDLRIHIVWAQMLGGDNEESARQMSKMFDDPRVEQYWDPKRLVGTGYSAQVFPTYLVDMEKGLDAALPADHWWRERERSLKSTKPEQAPLWDVAFTYRKGASWGSGPPLPRGMVKQVFFYGEQENGPSGMFFTDFKQPPQDGDWIAEVAKAMTSLLGREPKSVLAATPSQNDAETAGAIVIRREEESADARTVAFPDTPAGRIAKAFIAAFSSGDEDKMRVFSKNNRSKSALEDTSMKDRLEQYRELHGDWGQLDVRSVESHGERNVTVTVKPERGYSGLALIFQCDNAPPHKLSEIRIMPTYLDDGNDESSSKDAEGGKLGDVTLLTGSLKPLRDHFNANKHKHRFVALLSPT